jgi:hypothetical protein
VTLHAHIIPNGSLYARINIIYKKYKLLNKLPLILLCTIRIDNSLFDCRVLPQQGCNRATGSGTRIGALPLWYQCERAEVIPKSQ